LAATARAAVASGSSRLALGPVTEEAILPPPLRARSQHGRDAGDGALRSDYLDAAARRSLSLRWYDGKDRDPVELDLCLHADDVADLRTLRKQ
jgi:hypothetical protein